MQDSVPRAQGLKNASPEQHRKARQPSNLDFVPVKYLKDSPSHKEGVFGISAVAFFCFAFVIA